MKLWALILAVGATIALAASVADAATFSAGLGGSARSGSSIQRGGAQTATVFRDPLNGQTAFLYPLGRPSSRATQELVASGQLAALLAPKPDPWSYLWLGPWAFALGR